MAVTPAQRRMADTQRRKGIQVSNLYARSLVSLRTKEMNRVIRLAQDSMDARNWAMFFDAELNESKYFPAWYKGLFVNSGKIPLRQTVKNLAGQAAASAVDYGVFETSLMDYAERRAGELIVTVTGTLKDALRGEIYKALDEDINIGVEKLAGRLRQYAKDNLLWQARRIAQTESLAGLAEGAHEAADALNITYMKTWSVSGLSNSRDSHLAMDGRTIEEGDMFVFPDCEMRYPHDMTNGTAAQVCNCACSAIYTPK